MPPPARSTRPCRTRRSPSRTCPGRAAPGPSPSTPGQFGMGAHNAAERLERLRVPSRLEALAAPCNQGYGARPSRPCRLVEPAGGLACAARPNVGNVGISGDGPCSALRHALERVRPPGCPPFRPRPPAPPMHAGGARARFVQCGRRGPARLRPPPPAFLPPAAGRALAGRAMPPRGCRPRSAACRGRSQYPRRPARAGRPSLSL